MKWRKGETANGEIVKIKVSWKFPKLLYLKTSKVEAGTDSKAQNIINAILPY